MAQIALCVGIDVSKPWLDVYRHPDGAQARFSNDADGWAALLAWLDGVSIVGIGVEASGGFERGIVEALQDKHLPVCILDPWRVRLFARARGRRAKNDRIDARVIAEFTALGELACKLPDRARDRLGELLAARQCLIEASTRLGNVAEHMRDRRTTVLLRKQAGVLACQVDRLEQLIGEAIAAEADFSRIARLLMSVKGVGLILAATLIARLPELGTLNRRKICALVGVVPFDNDSGGRSGQRHIQGGRTFVRNVLYMATMGAATRHNPRLMAHFRHLRAQGKEPKVAIVACMRKLLTILNAMLATNQPWRELAPAA
jgi:transposase